MTITCESCKGNAKNISFNKNSLFLYQCNNCKLIFVHPAENKNIDLYHSEKFNPQINLLFNFLRYYTIHSWILGFCRKKEEILDFGCGRGEFLHYLDKQGWQVYGIDLMMKSFPFYQSSKFKNLIFPSLVNLRENTNIHFNTIMLNFSLEHCKNPLSTLKEINGLLKTSGFIFIRVPNLEHILKNKKLSSFQLKIPTHHYFFTPTSLRKILESSGFKTLSINTPFCITAAITPPCSIFPQLDPIKWLYIQNMPAKIIKGTILGILSLLFMPYTLSKSLSGYGIIIHAVAKKETQ